MSASPSTNGPDGRDARGRFAKGNAGGPGNPHARKVAQLRSALLRAVSAGDLRAVVKKLVDQKLTDQEIKRYNITVSEEEIDNNIEQIKAEKKWTDEDFREALKQESISIDFYREQLKQQALRSKLVNRAVKSNIVITNEDITAYYADNLEKFAGGNGDHTIFFDSCRIGTFKPGFQVRSDQGDAFSSRAYEYIFGNGETAASTGQPLHLGQNFRNVTFSYFNFHFIILVR